MKTKYTPKHLGQQSSKPQDEVDRIPWSGQPIEVTLECAEFTSLCPVTGQPDFGHVAITYQPRQCLIETKSLKLFLLRYRDRGVFSETLVNEIADLLFRQVQPEFLKIEGSFQSRGGISIHVSAVRERSVDQVD